MSETVSINGYGPSESALRVNVGRLLLWFSYQTCVAFEVTDPNDYTDPVVCANARGDDTDAKHIYWVNGAGEGKRLPRADFERQLSAVLEQFDLA